MNFRSSVEDLFDIKKHINEKNKVTTGTELLQGRTYLNGKKKMQKSLRKRTKLMEGFSSQYKNLQPVSQNPLDIVNNKEMNDLINMQDSMDKTLGIWSKKTTNIITSLQNQPEIYNNCVKICKQTKDGDLLTACINGCVGGNFASSSAEFRGPKPNAALLSGIAVIAGSIALGAIMLALSPESEFGAEVAIDVASTAAETDEVEATAIELTDFSMEEAEVAEVGESVGAGGSAGAGSAGGAGGAGGADAGLLGADAGLLGAETGLLGADIFLSTRDSKNLKKSCINNNGNYGVFYPITITSKGVKMTCTSTTASPSNSSLYLGDPSVCENIEDLEKKYTNFQLINWAKKISSDLKNIKQNMSEGDFIHNINGLAALVPGWTLRKSLAARDCSMLLTESQINSGLNLQKIEIESLFLAYSKNYNVKFTPLMEQSLDNKRKIIAQINSIPKTVNFDSISELNTNNPDVIEILSYGHSKKEGFTSQLPAGRPNLATVEPTGLTNDPYYPKMGTYGPGAPNRDIDLMRKKINKGLSSEPVHSIAEMWGGVGPVEGATEPDEITNVNPDGVRAQEVAATNTFAKLLKGLQNDPLIVKMRGIDNISSMNTDKYIDKLEKQWRKLFKDNCTIGIGGVGKNKFAGHQQYCKSWTNTRENRSGFYAGSDGKNWTLDENGNKVDNFIINTINLANNTTVGTDDDAENGRFGCDVLIPSQTAMGGLFGDNRELGGAGYCECVDGTKVYADAGHPEFSCNDLCAPGKKREKRVSVWHDPSQWVPSLLPPGTSVNKGIKAYNNKGDSSDPDGPFLQCSKEKIDIWEARCKSLEIGQCASVEEWPNGSGGRCKELIPTSTKTGTAGEPCDTRFGYPNQCSNCPYGTTKHGLTDWCCEESEKCSDLKPTGKCVPTKKTIKKSAGPPPKCSGNGMFTDGTGTYAECSEDGSIVEELDPNRRSDTGQGRACVYPLPPGGNKPLIAPIHTDNGMGGNIPIGYTPLPTPTELINTCSEVPYANIYIELLSLKTLELVLGAKSEIMFEVIKKSNIARRATLLKQSSAGRKLLSNIEKYKSVYRRFGDNKQKKNQLQGMFEDVSNKNASYNISYYIWFILAISGMMLVIKKVKN
jgi:hypothetical protein